MSGRRLRVLCLDIEGGHGGSSRSLFESVRHLDRGGADIEVWCRKAGPIQARYQKIGVPCRLAPTMPKVSALPRLSRNLFVFGLALGDFLRARDFRADLARQVNDRFDLVHFNHEALFLLARWLRPRTAVPFTMHVRTNLHDTSFARWQTRAIARTMDRLVFITENEKATFEYLSGGKAEGTIIYNVVAAPPDDIIPHPHVPVDGRFKMVSLSNYSWLRGTDRLIDVAAVLVAERRRDVLFVIAGDMYLPKSLPKKLGRISRNGGSLENYVEAHGVGDMFLFLGHVSEPERVLAACDALVKPTREHNPWGRDIIEAMAAGLPVLTCGADETFVENGVTGILQPEFDADAMAREIVRLADDRELGARMGAAGRERVLRLCDGTARAADLLAVWQNVTRS